MDEEFVAKVISGTEKWLCNRYFSVKFFFKIQNFCFYCIAPNRGIDFVSSGTLMEMFCLIFEVAEKDTW